MESSLVAEEAVATPPAADTKVSIFLIWLMIETWSMSNSIFMLVDLCLVVKC